MDSLNHLLVILSHEIIDGSADSCLEILGVLNAAFEVGLVVITSESSDKTSKEVSNLGGVEGEVPAVDRCAESTIDWSDENSGNISKSLSGSEVLGRVPVGLKS